jgi:hypothetical protein
MKSTRMDLNFTPNYRWSFMMQMLAIMALLLVEKIYSGTLNKIMLLGFAVRITPNTAD